MRQGRGTWARRGIGGLVGSVLALVVATPAAAGTYEVSSCRADFGNNPAHRFDGWTVTAPDDPTDPYFNHAEDCGAGGLLSSVRRTLHSAPGNQQYRIWTFAAPAGATISHLALWHFGAARTANTAVTLRRVRADGTTADLGDTRCTTACTPALGALSQGAVTAADRSDFEFPPTEATTGITYSLYCSPGGGDCAASDGSNPGGEMNIYGAVLTLSESGAPEVSDAAGSLWAEGAQAGTRQVTFKATDATSGVAKTRLVIDGRVAAEHQQACDGGRPTPCPTSVTDGFDLDVSPLGGGAHQAAIVAVDRAGNESSADATTHTVTVRGHDANGAGASPLARLRAFFGRNRHAKLRTRRSGTATIKGILRDENKAGIAGASLEIQQTVTAGGAQPTELPSVTTDAKGRFTFLVPPGPSRKIAVVYRAFADDPLPSQARTLTLTVPAGITLKATPRRLRNGQRMTLRGRLLTEPAPAGLLLNVQAFDRGRWIIVGTTHTGPGGRFAWRYRFKRTRAATTYPFRVQLRRQAAFPYAVSYSHAARVRVR